MRESGKSDKERVFNGKLLVNGGAQWARMEVVATEKNPIIGIAITAQGQGLHWKPEAKSDVEDGDWPSLELPLNKVTLIGVVQNPQDGGYKQKTEGIVKTQEGGSGNNTFDFDSSIGTCKIEIVQVPICMAYNSKLSIPIKIRINGMKWDEKRMEIKKAIVACISSKEKRDFSTEIIRFNGNDEQGAKFTIWLNYDKYKFSKDDVNLQWKIKEICCNGKDFRFEADNVSKKENSTTYINYGKDWPCVEIGQQGHRSLVKEICRLDDGYVFSGKTNNRKVAINNEKAASYQLGRILAQEVGIETIEASGGYNKAWEYIGDYYNTQWIEKIWCKSHIEDYFGLASGNVVSVSCSNDVGYRFVVCYPPIKILGTDSYGMNLDISSGMLHFDLPDDSKGPTVEAYFDIDGSELSPEVGEAIALGGGITAAAIAAAFVAPEAIVATGGVVIISTTVATSIVEKTVEKIIDYIQKKIASLKDVDSYQGNVIDYSVALNISEFNNKENKYNHRKVITCLPISTTNMIKKTKPDDNHEKWYYNHFLGLLGAGHDKGKVNIGDVIHLSASLSCESTIKQHWLWDLMADADVELTKLEHLLITIYPQ